MQHLAISNIIGDWAEHRHRIRAKDRTYFEKHEASTSRENFVVSLGSRDAEHLLEQLQSISIALEAFLAKKDIVFCVCNSACR